ncbi:hypothetical protein M2D07_028180 [Pseudomonas sp. BGr12]|uniref:hypothetical protein n=1 Tax=Pseudomonas sp. BGr12 TaxID=2936269 RepID=UPI002559A981|nr:hypothetical protein [Pseudomonas sp. BJa5]MDL2430927.1 hypothetical protein [Pseudomonas sp. BJa5]
MTSHTAILSDFLLRADITRQIERFVEAVRSSSEPAYRVLHEDSGEALYLPTPLAIPTTQLKLMHDFIMNLEEEAMSEVLRAFQDACRRVGLEFSPLVGMVCLSEDESRYLCTEESLSWLVRSVREFPNAV